MRVPVRALGAAVAAVVAGGLFSAPVAASAQAQCLPPGELVTPVPWGQALVAPDRAWPLDTGAGQRVAVISTGVSDTPYLASAVQGRVDLAPEESFGEPSGQIDCLGVGTAVAGIIAAQPSDGVGFHGVAPRARILDVKIVGDRFRTGEPANTVAASVLAGGIESAIDQDATVIVVPTITYEDTEALRQAVADALAAGIVVVASVGEPAQQEEPPGPVPYPAAYEGVIGVGALAADGTATISRTGHVDLVAPGVDLVTTYPGDGLGPVSGTAYAAAYVGGSVALLRGYRPGLSPDEVVRRLFATAAPAPEGVGSPRYGYGIVSPYHAMVDQVVEGAPVPRPAYSPAVVSEEELSRRAAQARGDALAARLTALGLVAAVMVAVAVGLGSRGRRRRWRVGLAAATPDLPEDERTGPPLELFGGRPPS